MTVIGPSMALKDIYRQIQSDLSEVESAIDRELHNDLPEVDTLCRHLGRFRGKMLRPALLLLAARATGDVKPIHLGLAAVVEMFHLASLIHDDVLDEAAMRRQSVTINAGWGNESAVMLGDWVIAHAYDLCTRQGSRWASLEAGTIAQRVCEGELMQLFGRGDLSVGVDKYLAVIAAKTASLTGLAARFGAHFNDAPPAAEQAFQDYGADLGIALQIIDDVLDLVGDEAEIGKTLGSDLAKGKATLPLIQFLASAAPAEADRVRALLAAPTAAGAEQVRQMLTRNGCIASAEAVALHYVQSAKSRLADLADSDAKTALQLLADFVLVRSR